MSEASSPSDVSNVYPDDSFNTSVSIENVKSSFLGLYFLFSYFVGVVFLAHGNNTLSSPSSDSEVCNYFLGTIAEHENISYLMGGKNGF